MDDDRKALDTSYEVDIDPEPEPVRKPVYVDAVVKPSGDLPPIIPASLRSWENFTATSRYYTRRYAHLTGLAAREALRNWLWQMLFWAPIGVFRLAGKNIRWVWYPQMATLMQAAADTNDLFRGPQIDKQLRKARGRRAFWFTVEVFALLTAGVLVWLYAPRWAVILTVVLTMPWLAHIGHPPARPIVRPIVLSARFRKLSYDVVARAYYAAKLGDVNKENQKIGFPSPGMYGDPRQMGTYVLVDLPFGKTFSDAVKAKPAIASGIDVTEQQVYLTRDKTSTRRHLLYVAHQDPLAIPAGRTPLLDCKPRDIWKPAPFGLDERGERVALPLMWNSVLVGAQPRKGKTFSARLPALYAALDPYTVLCIADGKMSPDWDRFRMVAHRYVCGIVPNSRDSNPIEHFLEMLYEVKRHIEQVNEVLSTLPVTECPEGKLTRDLSRKYPQLRVWLLVIEEFQNYFETDDQDTNKEIAGLLSFIMAVGPSSGVTILSASQKPSGVGAGDVGRLFTRYRDNHAVRFGLKCGNRDVSMAILGGDAYAEGYDASALPVGDEYLGVGYLYGAEDRTPTVRTYLADHEDAEKILRAARQHREQVGTLTGSAAGEEAARQARDPLADARSVFYAGEARISWPELAARLAEQLPGSYAAVTADAISAQLRSFGVPSKSVHDPKHFKSKKGQGCDLSAIDVAIRRQQIGSR